MVKKGVKSIRSRVLSVLFITGAIGIVGSFLVANSIERASEARTLTAEARSISRSVLQLAQDGQPPKVFEAIAHATPGIEMRIVRSGSVIYSNFSAATTSGGEIFTRSVGPVSVTVAAPAPNTTPLSAELTGVSAIVVLGVLSGAVWVTRIITKLVGGSVEEASAVAAKIESGDLSARLDTALPPEFEQLASAFDNMAAKLEESDSEQRRFLSDLVHEIATPINAVTGLAIAVADSTIDDESERAEAAELIASETRRIYRLLEDLRALDSLELGATASRTAFDSDELCRAEYQRFLPETRRKGIDFNFSCDNFRLIQDRRLIETVLDNLITNAIRYVNSGGSITLTGRTVAKELFAISVADTGIGIEERHLERIFDRLYRANDARDRASGGTGLGLSIARKAALTLGGKITVSSQYGHGSTFTLTFPTELKVPISDDDLQSPEHLEHELVLSPPTSEAPQLQIPPVRNG